MNTTSLWTDLVDSNFAILLIIPKAFFVFTRLLVKMTKMFWERVFIDEYSIRA